jgi:D-xylonolactonase
MVGGMTLQADGSLLLFMDRGTVAVLREGRIGRMLPDHIPAEADRRFNDVIADPAGRVFAGAMPFKDLDRKRGRLYRLDRDGSYEVVLEGVGIPNGMAFTSDRRSFYFIDSLDNVVWKFDYDPGTGAIGRRRDFLRFDPEIDGHADGMTLDQEDNLWIAMAMGGRVLQFGPDGSRKRSIELPAKFTASVTFGGEDLSDLYVTTGNHPEDEDLGPAAGALLVLKPGAVGVPEFRSRIAI